MSTLEFDEVDSEVELSLSIHTEKLQRAKYPGTVEDAVVSAAAPKQLGGISTNETPRLPETRGPGHTPRERAGENGPPPQRTPSRLSLRNGTPRQRDDMPTQDAKGVLGSSMRNTQAASKARASLAQSYRSVQFVVGEDATDTTSILFQAEASMRSRNPIEPSIDLQTYTDGSDINFDVEQSQAAALIRSGAATRSASLRFDVESTNDATHHSTISRFSIEGDEPEPKQGAAPVKAPKIKSDKLRKKQMAWGTRPSVEREENSPRKAASSRVVYGKVKPIEYISWSEKRRRAQRAEAEWRAQVLRERRLYMGERAWEANKPSPRARRTSSESAAYALKQQQEMKKEEADKRRRAMNARPWRTNSATPNKWRSVSRTKRRRWSAPPSARSEGVAMGEWRAAPLMIPQEGQAGDKAPANLAENLLASSTSSEEHGNSAAGMRYGRPRSPVFNRLDDAKFVTPAPVLKAPLEVMGEELEDWTYTVNQQRNLQAMAQVMRARERTLVQLVNQLKTHSSVMMRLNKNLYGARDHYMQQHGGDVGGAALIPRKSKTPQSPGRTKAGGSPGAARLYKEERHRATDYYAMKMSGSGPRPVSVLSDDELSDSERERNAKVLESWRVERAVLREEKVRMVRFHRDLVYQMRRGSNIKDIAVTQPTSARGPLERAAAGTETAADVDGYDRLRGLRMQTQRALVEAANAKKVYEATLRMAATMSERYNPSSAEVEGTKEWWNTAREKYVSSLQELQQSVNEARPLLERANALKALREKKVTTLLDERATEDLQEYSDAVLAVRMQTDRAQALAEAAANHELHVVGSVATPKPGTSQATTPCVTSSNGDDVYARWTP
ncbi:hypothetical protein LSCM1_05311 [Leishmania martiniquensis]|uniref:Uncharacterized protein n=1 Tax=Leishmania martiniquensis TaxID=1580590 RepID=A0A836KL37_9TRYP|nr:hypothetical protein LSCM1_05311 [Leishmania martiniquensis]